VDLKQALAQLEPALAEASPPATLARAAEILARLAGWSWCGLLLIGRDEIAAEGWWGGGLDPARSAEFRKLAAATSAAGTHLPSVNGVRTISFDAGPSTRGVACGQPVGERAGLDDDSLRALLQVLGLRLQVQRVTASGEESSRQYERWFRTLDEQIRVLDRERQKFSAVVQQSNARVFVADVNRHIKWTNTTMRQETSPSGEPVDWTNQICGAVCCRLGADSRECPQCPVHRAIAENKNIHREFRWDDEQGTHHHYLTALPIRAADGKPEEVMVMIQDLGDLGTLRRSETRYRMLFERSNKAILLLDPATSRILQANPMAARMTGFSTGELTQHSLRDLHAPAEWERLEATYARALRDRALDPLECRIRARDGSERIAMVAGARYEMGEQDVFMLDLQDVTERRRVEEALRRAEASLRTVISHAPIVLFSIDATGTFTMSEGRGLEALGLRSGEVVGCSVFDLYEKEPEVLDHVRQALAGAEFTASATVAGHAFETHYTPARNARGEILGIMGVAIDVTDRRRLEDQLLHSQKMEAIGRLAGGVAHDFNNLLAAILGQCELLLRDLQADEAIRDAVEEIHRSGVRGALLTRQLLAFSRRDVPTPQALDMTVVVAEMDGLLRRLIGEDIELVTRLAAEPCVVRADRSQIEQVVLNLVVNSRDALPEGGRITLDVGAAVVGANDLDPGVKAPPGPYVRFEVTDDGCGMDEATLARAFEPFFSTKEMGKGTGLGLSTVYGIIERNGGWIRARSAPGKGTSFCIHLPRLDEIVARDPVAVPRPVQGGHETILLVEDEPAVRELVRDALLHEGYRLLVAEDGPTALKLAAQHAGRLDLLLTNVVMPRMGGGELASRLAAARPGLRVLYMSGYTDDAVVRHGVEEARVAFLQKPFRLEDLARKVREVLDAPSVDDGDAAQLGAA
jgi:PAS domain S-box-containing protein